MRKVYFAVPALLLVAACASGNAIPGAAGSAASPSGPPADGGTYSNTDAILAALSAAGSPCVDPSPVANPTAKGALSMVDCGSAPGQSDVVVVVFDSQADAQGFAENMTAPGPLSADAVIYGRNWAVNATRAYAPLIQRALGGGELNGTSPSTS